RLRHAREGGSDRAGDEPPRRRADEGGRADRSRGRRAHPRQAGRAHRARAAARRDPSPERPRCQRGARPLRRRHRDRRRTAAGARGHLGRRPMTRNTFVLVALASCLVAAPACRRARYAGDDTSKVHVGIVFDIGGKDDRSFNAAAWAGVKCAETGTLPDGKTSCGKPALGIVLRDVEPGTPNSIEPAMRAFAERGYDLVIGVGFTQAPIMQVVARDYPNIRFAIIDGVVFQDDGKSPMPNVAGLLFKEHEGSYLVGMIAAKTS